MKVRLLQADLGGSGFLRMSEPATAARALGHETLCNTDADVVAESFPDGSFKVHEVTTECDVLVLQRVMTQGIFAVAEQAKRQGITVVVDIDDDFHTVHPKNVAAAAADPRVNPMHNRDWLTRTTAIADWVTVSTPALLKYARKRDGRTRGSVVRNYLPARALMVQASPFRAERHPGWGGSVSTHPKDLQQAAGILDGVTNRFAVVGDLTGVASALGVPKGQAYLAQQWTKSVEEYWQALADHVDVGIAPLQSSPFNNAKSWLKCVEYATLGIPFVASPTPEYRRFVRESGAGVIAKSEGQWRYQTQALLKDEEAARELGHRGRAWAWENTLEDHAQSWVDAWEKAAQ